MELGVTVDQEQKGTASSDQDFLQYGMLVLILLLATACRFYRIENQNLWGLELVNAVRVLNCGWLDMVSSMVYGSTEPPGYATVLYIFSQLFGYSEFALQLPSMLAGIGCVYVIYLLGKRVHSSYAGLLAAAGLACSYHLIDYSREVQVGSLLMFFVLINFYYFLSVLFIECNDDALTALNIEKKNKIGSFSLAWQTPISCSPVNLLLFWLSGIVMLYLQYMAIFIILVQVLLVFLLCSWRSIGGRFGVYAWAMFIPALISFLPWLPAIYVHIEKILPIFYVDGQGSGNSGFIINLLFSRIPQLQMPLFFLTLLAVAFCFYALMRRRLSHLAATSQDVTFLFVLFLSACFLACSIFFPVIGNPGVYLILHPLIVLMLAVFLCDVIKIMPFHRAGKLIIFSIISLFLLVNFEFNQSSELFGDKRAPDVGAAVKVISKDESFMAGAERPVFMSLASMGYYLHHYGVQSEPSRFVVGSLGDDVAKIKIFSTDRTFYYIDVVDRPEYKVSSPTLDALLQKYQMVCRSESAWFRLVKFNVDKPPIAAVVVEDCNSKIVSTRGSSVADRKKLL